MTRFRVLSVRSRPIAIAIAFVLAAVVAAGCKESAKQPASLPDSKNGTRSNEPTAEQVRWLTDLEQAKQVAAAEGKDLFINFTGLSWCGPCMELEYEVLNRVEFAPMAERFVLVRLDYPSGVHRLPQEPPEPQVSWRDFYGVHAFPTVLLADATGKPYALTGNIGLKSLPYVEHIETIRTAHRLRDEAFARASTANGIEKAKYLAAGLTALRQSIDASHSTANTDPFIHFYREEIDQVLRLDADNATGVRGPIEKMLRDQQTLGEDDAFYASLNKTFQEQGVDATLHILDEELKIAKSVERHNQLRQVRRTYLELGRRFEDAVALSRELADDESLTSDARFASRRRIARDLWELDRHRESLAEYDALVAESADDLRRQVSVLREKAGILRQNERFDEALAAYERIIAIAEPDSETLRTAIAWRINTRARLGRSDDAWKAWEEAGKSGWRRPMDATNMMVMIAHYLNEHGGSRDAAVAAAARAEKALDEMVAESDADARTIATHRETLDRIKAGPTRQASDSNDFSATEKSK